MRASPKVAGCRQMSRLLQRLSSRSGADMLLVPFTIIVAGLSVEGPYKVCVCGENSGGQKTHCADEGEDCGVEAAAEVLS
jgi:hypothetical protein